MANGILAGYKFVWVFQVILFLCSVPILAMQEIFIENAIFFVNVVIILFNLKLQSALNLERFILQKKKNKPGFLRDITCESGLYIS